MKVFLQRTGNFVSSSTSWVGTIGGFVGMVAMYLMVAVVTVEVLSRFLLNKSTLIADEMAGYLLVVMSYTALAYTLQQGGHIRVEIVTQRLPLKIQQVIERCTLVLSLAASVILTRWAWYSVVDSYEMGAVSVTVLRTPQYIPQLFIAVGISVLVIQLAVNLFKR